jgi:hypothetical protein
MKTKNIAAFPLKHSDDKFNPGMTLRDYFAGQALAGLVTNTYLEDLGELSYKIAEVLLIERQKYEPKDNR